MFKLFVPIPHLKTELDNITTSVVKSTSARTHAKCLARPKTSIFGLHLMESGVEVTGEYSYGIG